jgi:hypothetical protein
MRQLAFWDTSALVPLCVPQVFSARVTALINNHDAVVWWATPVEIAGALARLVRMKQIDLIERAKANRLAKSLADKWYVIDPSDTVLARGGAGVVRRQSARPRLPNLGPKTARGGAVERLRYSADLM